MTLPSQSNAKALTMFLLGYLIGEAIGYGRGLEFGRSLGRVTGIVELAARYCSDGRLRW